MELRSNVWVVIIQGPDRNPIELMQEGQQKSKVNKEYQLEDKYLLESGRAFLTGTQALVRLPLMQRRKDLSKGLNTAGYISGYTGSPLGGYDHALKQS